MPWFMILVFIYFRFTPCQLSSCLLLGMKIEFERKFKRPNDGQKKSFITQDS